MQIANPLASFTRPANTTAYAAAGLLIANSVTAGSVVPMAFKLGNSFPVGQFRLTRARVFKSGTAITGADFRLHLYENLPVCSNGDGAAWLTDNAAHWLGNIDISSMLAFSDGAAGTGSCPAGSEIMCRMYRGNIIYGLLAKLTATSWTPASGETITAMIEELDAY